MADLSVLLQKNFSAEKFPPGKRMSLTIKAVKAAEVGVDKEVKPVAYFVEDPRGLVLNNTNYDLLAKAHKTTDVDVWAGAKIEIFTHEVRGKNGKPTLGMTLAVKEVVKR